MKSLILPLVIIFMGVSISMAQTITLEEAIALAQNNSYEYKVALNRYQSSKWNYENYKSSFLPTLSLNGTIPNYSRSINKITLPNGEDRFISQNQSYSTVNLGLRQNISLTGGIVTLGSNLNRIDVFGNNRYINYSTAPMSVSYTQNNIGFNSFKWQKKTEPLRFEAAKRELINSMQQIGEQTTSIYFNIISTRNQQQLSKQNLSNADTLHRIAKDRFKLGTVGQDELLQLRLNILSAQNRFMEDSISYVLARQQFARYLLIDDTDRKLVMPENITFFNISLSMAIDQAKNNSQAILEFRLKRLEAERNLAETKAENKLKFNVQANFGLSNTSQNFKSLFNAFENQQNIMFGFSLPLLDWGYGKTQKLKAQANLDMVKSSNEQQEMQLEQEISLHVAKWNLQKKNMDVAIETQQIAIKNYELALQRYKAGRISINDLNIAQNQKDTASSAYIQAIKNYWILYYTIRKLTLYDFENNAKIILQ